MSAWAAIRGWLRAPGFVDDERARVAKMLHILVLSFLIANTVGAGSRLVLDPQLFLGASLILLNGLYLSLYWLLRRGHVHLSAWSFIAVIWIAVTAVCALQGGLRVPVILGYPLIILITNFLLGSRAGLFVTVLSVAAAAGLHEFEARSLLISSEYKLESAWMTAAAVIFFLCHVLAWLGVRSIRASYDKIRQNQEELERTNQALRATHEQLAHAKLLSDAANRAKGEFVANVSHELRTPLNGVIGMAALLDGTALTAEQREFVDTIRGSGDALLRLIDTILDFSKLEAKSAELEAQPFSVRECVAAAVATVSAMAQVKGLAIEYRLDPRVPAAIVGDARVLRQVLVALLDNAVKFSDRGAIIVSLESRPVGDEWQLEFAVLDAGIGILPGAEEIIFEAFRQGDASTTRAHGGAGLGLAICRQQVALMGGRIWVDTSVEEGACVRFTVRARPAPADAPPSPGERASPPPLPALRVLLAEDNPINQKVALRLLSRLGQDMAGVTVVPDGQAAMDAVLARRFDVVLMDVQMPVLDGVQATARIRAQVPREAQPYIIAMTANVMAGDRERYLAAGMDTYLGKPFTPEDLEAVLRKSLEPRG